MKLIYPQNTSYRQKILLSSIINRIPGDSDDKESTSQAGNASQAGDVGSMPGSGIFLAEGNGNPLQYSHLENFMDRGAWRSMGSKSRT